MGFAYIEGPTHLMEYPQAASQAFKKGDLVYLVGGAVTVVAADTRIGGVAMEDAGATGDMIQINKITPDQLWVAQADDTTTQAMEGQEYGLNIGTPGSMSIDIADTTDTAFAVDQLDPQSGPTTGAGGKMIGRFLNAVIAGLNE
jgi:hypothetical protein